MDLNESAKSQEISKHTIENFIVLEQENKLYRAMLKQIHIKLTDQGPNCIPELIMMTKDFHDEKYGHLLRPARNDWEHNTSRR